MTLSYEQALSLQPNSSHSDQPGSSSNDSGVDMDVQMMDISGSGGEHPSSSFSSYGQSAHGGPLSVNSSVGFNSPGNAGIKTLIILQS
jgi:hypothetical protein